MKTYLYALALLSVLSGPAFAADYNVIPSSGHQPIKAQVTDATPAHYTINLKKAANLGANEHAKTFAMYVRGNAVPSKCGDFTADKIAYQKPDKYHRIFNLKNKPEVLDALNQYGCVVITNRPALPPAKS